MTGLLTLLVRRSAIKKHASDIPTGIRPVGDLHSATVFVDATLPYCQQAIDEINNVLPNLGIKVNVYAMNLGDQQMFNEEKSQAQFIHKRNVNCFGRIRRNSRTPVIEDKVDLFISLLPENIFPVEFEARRSKAVFKIARRQLKDQLFDLIVNDNESEVATQNDVFKEIIKILGKIK